MSSMKPGLSAPEDVYVLDPRPSPSVTLVTCYPFYYFGSRATAFHRARPARGSDAVRETVKGDVNGW